MLPNAFITLLTSTSYLPGALVLLHSLLDLHPAPRDFKTVCLVTPETVDARSIGELRKAGWDFVIGVEGITSGSNGQEGLDLMGRPDLNLALTKLHIFRLSSLFSTLIYLDADVLPLRPLSHLFTITNPHVISACPDTGWPDCFNSGVMVIRPRESDWEGLKGLLDAGPEDGEGQGQGSDGRGNGSFDGADQGLLNEWFSTEGGGGDWNRLPFTYNVTPTAAYTYAPAYRRFGHKINVVHFIGSNKPWSNLQYRPAGISTPVNKELTYDYPALIDRWYAVYDKHIRPTAAHHPDLGKRFAVPETVAVWNQPAPEQPADRLSLEALKDAASFGLTTMRPGQYLSLPLEGRVDLIRPKPQPKTLPVEAPAPEIEASVSPTISNLPPLESAPPPQSLEQQFSQPSTWDASRSSPPKTGRPEMEIPMDTFYESAWDAPPSQQSSYYSSTHNPSDYYPTLPKEVQNNDWYKEYHNQVPDRNYSHPVFPWEHARPTPGRVFPRGDTPPPTSSGNQNQHQSQTPKIEIKPSTPDETPSHQPEPEKPKSMAEAMASYTNAWDSDPAIRRYVSRLTGVGLRSHPSSPPPITSPGVGGVTPPNTSLTFSQGISKNIGGGDTRSEGSRDGDDEDDDMSSDDEGDGDSSGRSRTTSGEVDEILTPTEGNRHARLKYRDRKVQTETPGLHDAKVQTSLGFGNKTQGPELPMTASRRPSHNNPERFNHPSRGKTQSISTSQTQSQSHSQHQQSRSEINRPRSDRNTSSETVTSNSQDVLTPVSSPPANSGNPSRTIPFPTFSSASPSTHQDQGQGQGLRNKPSGGRIWDPSTDIDVRKRDTQEVLSRFMSSGGTFSGSSAAQIAAAGKGQGQGQGTETRGGGGPTAKTLAGAGGGVGSGPGPDGGRMVGGGSAAK